MAAANQQVDLSDKEQTLDLTAGSYVLDVNLGTTYSTNPNACLKEPANMPVTVENSLISRLEALHTEEFYVSIDKQAAAAGTASSGNVIRLRGDSWLNLGLNNDRIGAGFPTVTFQGGDIDDATRTRVFTFQPVSGDVRVVERYDANGDGKIKANEPVAHLTCPLSSMTPIVLTVAPSS